MSNEIRPFIIQRQDVEYLLKNAVDEKTYSWGETAYNCKASQDKCKCYELVGGVMLYFSYNTLVGFTDVYNKRYVIKNYWRSSTGRHINFLERDVKKRLFADDFHRQFQKSVINVIEL